MRHHFMLVLLGGAFLTGCGNIIDCAVNGDNLGGRVTFSSGVAIRQDASVVVQWSTDSFAATKSGTAHSNQQGLLAVPYSFCVPAGTYQLRAFQDLNGNSELDAGESSGRLDGTGEGDAAFVSKTITTDASNVSSRVTDADLVIDTN